jgi:hypothetical protein
LWFWAPPVCGIVITSRSAAGSAVSPLAVSSATRRLPAVISV